MVRTSPSRWLAPLAIVAVAGVAVAIVGSSGGSKAGPAATPALDGDLKRTTTTTSAPKTTTTEAGPATYTVKSGDTLSAISVDTGVSITRLQKLNPDIDVQALQLGQTLNLR